MLSSRGKSYPWHVYFFSTSIEKFVCLVLLIILYGFLSQGPPGVGDLSKCRYNTHSHGSPTYPYETTETTWIPQDDDLQVFSGYGICIVHFVIKYLHSTILHPVNFF